MKIFPKVSIIILNWNGWKDTIECLESLYQINYSNYDVILVDNNSQDNSIEKIKKYSEGEILIESKFFKYHPENKPIKIIEYTREEAESGGEKENEIKDLPSNRKLILIKNEKNYGFAEGNNIAMRYALKTLNPKYILLLNNDTVVDKEFLNVLVKVACSNPKIGIAGSKTYYYDQPNVIQYTWNKIAFRRGEMFFAGTGYIDRGQYNNIRDTDYVQGSCFLIKREVVEVIGLFDVRYYCYWEENDYCMRAKNTKYQCIYCPKAKIWHKGGVKDNLFSMYYSNRNRFLFMKKHANNWQLLLFLLYFFGFQFWFLSGKYLVYLRDIKKFISFFKGVIGGIKILLHDYRVVSPSC